MDEFSEREIRSLTETDHRHSWKPFTQMKQYLAGEPLIFADADGHDLIDVRGRRFFDGVSSIWCNLLGHCHPTLDAAVRRQLDRFAHSTLLGPTHVPAVKLAGELARIAPPGLERVFFSDNGSTGNEVALKMAFQFHQHRGATGRTRFIALRDGYHGDTLGAVGVGGINLFHAIFRPLLMDTLLTPPPYCYRCELVAHEARDEPELLFYPDVLPPECKRCGMACLQALEELLDERGEEVCALVMEPVVQGAAGIHMAAPGYLKGARELCRRHGVLLIADEVATGFGRTGRLFACEHEEISPDLMILSKSLTGGYSPMAATLATAEVFEAFLGDYADYKTFFHGHTYTGHPLGAAAALAVIEALDKEDVLANVKTCNHLLREKLRQIGRHPNVGRIHLAGLWAGIELVADRRNRKPFAPERRVGAEVCRRALDHGLLIRPLGDVVIVIPPLNTPPEKVGWVCDVVQRCIGETLGS